LNTRNLNTLPHISQQQSTRKDSGGGRKLLSRKTTHDKTKESKEKEAKETTGKTNKLNLNFSGLPSLTKSPSVPSSPTGSRPSSVHNSPRGSKSARARGNNNNNDQINTFSMTATSFLLSIIYLYLVC
jgi:hypothetical protein